MDLSIIIVSWNVKDKLKECIKSILETAGDLDYEVIIVDNASVDGTAEMIKNEFLNRYGALCLIENKINSGFAKANNQGLKVSKGEYVLFLNPDMRVLSGKDCDGEKGTLQTMVDFMRFRPDVGIASCKLIKEDGAVLREIRRFPTIWSQLAVILKLNHFFPDFISKMLVQDINMEKEQEVDQVRGSFFMANRKMIEDIGAWDERFFIWFEDVDWCKRAHEALWRVMYTPKTKCVDYIGQSFKQARLYHKQKYFIRSMREYFKKHGKWWEAALIGAVRPFALAIAFAADLFLKKGKSM